MFALGGLVKNLQLFIGIKSVILLGHLAMRLISQTRIS